MNKAFEAWVKTLPYPEDVDAELAWDVATERAAKLCEPYEDYPGEHAAKIREQSHD